MFYASHAIKFFFAAVLSLAAIEVQANQIASRNILDNLLRGNQVFEDFETPAITSQTRYSGGSYDSSVNFAGLGMGQVVDGVTFQRNTSVVAVGASGYRGIDWNPSGYFGATSQRLSGAGGGGGASTRNDFQFIFTAPVTAFGVDLTAYNGFASSGKASVYDNNDNLLGTINITGTVAGSFFGWENPGGIGKVYFHDTPNQNYIQFDNLGFGVTAVPIPGAIWLFGSALAGVTGFSRKKRN